jgi:hypothetical protein
VLAIAILGIVMLRTFEHRLVRDVTKMSLTAEIRNALDAQRIKLAAIEIPE